MKIIWWFYCLPCYRPELSVSSITSHESSQSEGVCGFGLQGQSDLLRGAKMDSLDSLRQLALACEACGLTSSSNSSSSSISADHYYSSHPLSGRRSSSHGNGRIWGVSRRRCECRKAEGGRSELSVNACLWSCLFGCTELMRDGENGPW